MSCKNIHDEMNKEYMTCPFCNKQLNDLSPKEDQCCENMNKIKDNEANICQSCGALFGYEQASEYIDFHESRHRIRRKSVYHRKYYIKNILADIRQKHKIEISYKKQQKIEKIFTEIGKVNKLINENRKRMISVYYILHKVLSLMNISSQSIPLSKSKKTLSFYKKYWNNIMILNGDEIMEIIDK